MPTVQIPSVETRGQDLVKVTLVVREGIFRQAIINVNGLVFAQIVREHFHKVEFSDKEIAWIKELNAKNS